MVSVTNLPTTIAYLSGEYVPLNEAKISPLDRGFLFADAVYEVIPVYNGSPFLFHEHVARLERSLQELHIANPHSKAQWAEIVRTLIAKNGGGDLSLYLQVSRGVDPVRNHVITPSTPPTVFLMVQALPPIPVAMLEQGAKAITTEDLRWLRCDIKSVNLLPNILAKTAASDSHALEALMIRNGYLTEGSSSSALIVKDQQLLAPEYSRELLPGTTRNLLQSLAESLGIHVQVGAISQTALMQADEVMIGFATRGVIAITDIDGQVIGTGKPGSIFKQLRARFDEHRLTPVPY